MLWLERQDEIPEAFPENKGFTYNVYYCDVEHSKKEKEMSSSGIFPL